MNKLNDDPSNPDREDPTRDDFIRRLAALTPAPVPGNAHDVFYQAGFLAASQQYQRQHRSTLRKAIAAAVMAVCITGVVSYQLGSSAREAQLANRRPPSATETNAPVQPSSPVQPEQAPTGRNVPSQSPALAAASTNAVPSGLLSRWLPPVLNNRMDRPLSLIGAKSAQESTSSADDNNSSTESTISLPAEPTLRRSDWQTILPTL